MSQTTERNNQSIQARGAGAQEQAAPEGAAEGPNGEKQIKIDGFGQVLAMLQAADPEFRASLLKRIGARDPRLAKALREGLDQ